MPDGPERMPVFSPSRHNAGPMRGADAPRLAQPRSACRPEAEMPSVQWPRPEPARNEADGEGRQQADERPVPLLGRSEVIGRSAFRRASLRDARSLIGDRRSHLRPWTKIRGYAVMPRVEHGTMKEAAIAATVSVSRASRAPPASARAARAKRRKPRPRSRTSQNRPPTTMPLCPGSRYSNSGALNRVGPGDHWHPVGERMVDGQADRSRGSPKPAATLMHRATFFRSLTSPRKRMPSKPSAPSKPPRSGPSPTTRPSTEVPPEPRSARARTQ